MNKSERKAYNWLIKQGFQKEAIVFQKTKSPDFIFTDRNDKIEVKRLYANKILLRTDQFAKLKDIGGVKILVFSDELEDPVATIAVDDIEEGDETAEGVLLHWIGRASVIKISEHVKAELDKIKDREGHTSYDSVIRVLLLQREELMRREKPE